MGFARASIVLGVVGACWHLPLFFVPGLNHYGQSFPLFALEVVALYVAATWLYVHTNGSVLMAMLMHSAVNQAIGAVPWSSPPASNPFTLRLSLVGWLSLSLLGVTAGYLFVRLRRSDTSTGRQEAAASEGTASSPSPRQTRVVGAFSA